jgi:trimethylamine--corrinoid protein Co-methyltransferase
MEDTMKLSLLTEEQIKKLHNTSIHILERIGAHIPHEGTIKLLEDAGAKVNHSSKIVKIPEKIVDRCLKTCKKQFTLYGRDRTKIAEFGFGKRNYQTIGGNPFWIEDDLQRRRSTLEDVRIAARIGDALPRLNVVGAMSDANDIPSESRYLYIAAELLKNTTKPILFFFNNRATAEYITRLFTIVAGSEEEATKYPFTYMFFEPISPLRFPKDGVDVLFEISRIDLPVTVGPCSLMGATAPGTLAGTMAQTNAEILAGICIVQLIKPGVPVFYGDLAHNIDMSTTSMVAAGPESTLMIVGLAEIAKYYGLPVYVDLGVSDSKIQDAQAGLEAGVTLACGAMAGADIFGSFGSSGEDQGTSLLMLMIQHELIGFIERMMKGIEISNEKLGVDIIEKARAKGSFIEEDHTLKHFREELWFPQLLDRNFWQKWFDEGHKDMRTRCKEMKDRLLKEHTPEPLDKEVEREVDKLLNDAKKHLADMK